MDKLSNIHCARLATLMLALTLCLPGCRRHEAELEPHLIVFDMGRMGIPEHEQFREVRNVKQLPNAVEQWFQGGIAEPGEKYFETDVGDSRLPIYRLLVAGTSSRYCIINYERGGFAHAYTVALFALGTPRVNPVWVGRSGNFTTLRELKAAVESGKILEVRADKSSL